MNLVEKRTFELKRLQEFYEKERDKLYDQVANLQGQKERLDWAIRVINAQIAQIEKEEQQKAVLAMQQQQALEAARQQGNVASHPSERKGNLAERKARTKNSKDEFAEE
jgi:hypothetical protein